MTVISEAYGRRSDSRFASSCNGRCGDERLSRRGRFRRAELCGVHRRNTGDWQSWSALYCGACCSHVGCGFRESNQRHHAESTTRKTGQESGSSISTVYILPLSMESINGTKYSSWALSASQSYSQSWIAGCAFIHFCVCCWTVCSCWVDSFAATSSRHFCHCCKSSGGFAAEQLRLYQ